MRLPAAAAPAPAFVVVELGVLVHGRYSACQVEERVMSESDSLSGRAVLDASCGSRKLLAGR